MVLPRAHGTRGLPVLVAALACAAAPACSNEHRVEGAALLDAAAPGSPSDAAIDVEIDASGSIDAAVIGDAGPEVVPVDCTPYRQVESCVLRVAPGASASATGLSWQDPIDLQAALDYSACSCEVWIAAGTYLPTRQFLADDPRTRSFQLQPSSHVLGGFAGTETAAEQRDPDQHVSILSGDVGEPGIREDNAYHVVIGADAVVLEGLTIRDGQADGLNDGQLVGGGLFNEQADVTLRRVNVIDNDAVTGAGIYNDGASHAQLYDCYIARNIADTGGGLFVGGASNAHVERTVFSENVAIFIGGGIAQGVGILEVVDSRFVGNRGDFGGGFALSGGTAKIERSWFEANWAGLFGGAAIVRDGASASFVSSVLFGNTSVGHGGSFTVWTATLQLSGVTLVGGSAGFGGAMLIKDQSQISVGDSLVWGNEDNDSMSFLLEGTGNSLIITNSLVPNDPTGGADGGVPEGGNFAAEPMFLNVPLRTHFTERAGTADELRVADPGDFAIGDRIELGDDGIERAVSALTEQGVIFTPPLSGNTARFLRIDVWPAAATSLDLDLHVDPASPAIDRASSTAPELDFYGQSRVDITAVGTDCGDAGCSAADLGAIETLP